MELKDKATSKRFSKNKLSGILKELSTIQNETEMLRNETEMLRSETEMLREKKSDKLKKLLELQKEVLEIQKTYASSDMAPPVRLPNVPSKRPSLDQKKIMARAAKRIANRKKSAVKPKSAGIIDKEKNTSTN